MSGTHSIYEVQVTRSTGRVGLAIVCAVLTVPLTLAGAQVYSVEHVSVLTMASPEILPDQTIVIANGKISQMGPSSQVRPPRNSQKIDGRGRYILPGLADMHVHLQSPIDLTLFLVNGVTTVFDLNGKPAYLDWRRRVTKGEMLGPQLFLCGPYFRDPEPVSDAVARVDKIADAGYDAIKIKNNVTAEEFDGIVRQAKTRRLLILGHYPRKVAWEHVLASGLNLAHEEEVLYGAFLADGDNGNVDRGPQEVEKVVEQIATSKSFLIPNLVMYKAIFEQASDFDGFARRPEFAYLSPWQKVRFTSQNPYKNRPLDRQREFRTNLQFMVSVLTPALQKAGVRMLAGTDAEGLGTVAGFSLIDELETLHESGLTNYQALQTATTSPALFVGKQREFGELEPGMRADMVLVHQNPLADLGNLRDLVGVFVFGKWMPRKELDDLREDVPKLFNQQLTRAEKLLDSNQIEEFVKFTDFNDPYQRMGGLLLTNLFHEHGFEAVATTVKKLRQSIPGDSLTSEAAINSLGYTLLGQHDLDGALQIFKWNVEKFPKSANTYDSLADAYIAEGDTRSAVEAYKKALEVDATYANGGQACLYLKNHGSAR